MEVFLERLLLELVVIAVQLAIMRLVARLRTRSPGIDADRSITITA
ncbi:MAG: hypothetical protein ABSB99_10270 [Acidimicrobiales bacterium]|jgi:hypothetical protein